LNKKTKAPISSQPDAYRRIGQVVGAFGIRGQVKVDPLTDFLDRFDKGTSLLLEDREVVVQDVFWHKGHIVIKLSGIDDPDEAQKYQFKYLYGSTDFEPDLGEGEYLTADLLGLTVKTVTGEEIGVVDDVLSAPAHDIIQVGEVLIPAVKQFIKSIDVNNRIMVVELIEGMLPNED
jgi:16S rRNA processing protein RimM